MMFTIHFGAHLYKLLLHCCQVPLTKLKSRICTGRECLTLNLLLSLRRVHNDLPSNTHMLRSRKGYWIFIYNSRTSK